MSEKRQVMKLTDKRFWKFEAMMLLCGVLTLLFVFCSCSNRHDLTDNYSVFTYGEGLYGESERDYPIFVSNSDIRMNRHTSQMS